jgi:hypothetical protein
MESDLQCQEKLVDDTKNEASAAATTLKWQKGIKLRPYKCRRCGLWHLTSQHS